MPNCTVLFLSLFYYLKIYIQCYELLGHHADIGGITPGSMPPFSKSLLEEGTAIKVNELLKQKQGGINQIFVLSIYVVYCCFSRHSNLWKMVYFKKML